MCDSLSSHDGLSSQRASGNASAYCIPERYAEEHGDGAQQIEQNGPPETRGGHRQAGQRDSVGHETGHKERKDDFPADVHQGEDRRTSSGSGWQCEHAR